MKNEQAVELSYRMYYGKLFASLIKKFGAQHVNQIEDAIQNAFYQSLKSWKPDQIPENIVNWLYIVARNDVLNQIKRESKQTDHPTHLVEQEQEVPQEDFRLQTILYLAHFDHISSQAKILFILKNIFGLQVKEISESTLLSEEAIYKSIIRAKKSFHIGWNNNTLQSIVENSGENELHIVEETLYAVFNIGFDSFNKKSQSISNDDVCLEALALAKLLLEKFERKSTHNLIALFCFHLARMPSKLNEGQLVSFYQQDRSNWNTELIDLAFHHLKQPEQLNKYYLEALIASKYMLSSTYNQRHWNDVISLYQLLIQLTDSPIAKLNLCYCYHKANKTNQAITLLETINKELPTEHIYYSLVKAKIIKKYDEEAAHELVLMVIDGISQNIRKDYLRKMLA